MRRLVFNLHLFIALVAGTFMMILGLTGSIMEFAPELDRIFHPNLSYVTPGPQTLSLHEMGDAVSQKFGAEPIVAYLPSQSSNLSWQVVLPSGIAYVNQYTGKVLGIRMRGQTFLGRVRAIHVRLAAGDVGREIMRWSGVAMILSLAILLLLAINAVAGDLTGKWSGTFKVDGGDHTVPQLFTLKQQGNKLTGTGGPNSGEQYPVEHGRVDGNRVTFEVTSGEWKFTYDLKVSDTKMTGELKLKAMNDSRTATVALTKAE